MKVTVILKIENRVKKL